MQARRLETVVQFCSDPEASARWHAEFFGVEATPDGGPYFRFEQGPGYAFNEEPFDIPPGRLVTIDDPDGNIIGLIDNSKGGMPGGI